MLLITLQRLEQGLTTDFIIRRQRLILLLAEIAL
jgi:hypothetical protein